MVGWYVFYAMCAIMGIANIHDLYNYYQDFPFVTRNSFDDFQLLVLDRMNVIDIKKKYEEGVRAQQQRQQ